MPIVITVEDGSNVPDANSFVSVAEVRSYALSRGVTLSAVDDDIAPLIIKATDYLESQACRYQGDPVYADQSLQWPRYGVYINDIELISSVIPKQLKNAQCALVLAANEGFELLPNISAQSYVTEETVGPITTKYANPVAVGVTPTFTAVEAFLAPLFGVCHASGFGIRTARV